MWCEGAGAHRSGGGADAVRWRCGAGRALLTRVALTRVALLASDAVWCGVEAFGRPLKALMILDP